MPTLLLTAKFLENVKPGEKDVDYVDQKDRKLVFRVTPRGKKTWRARYYVKSQPRTYGLGTYPDLGLAAARKELEQFVAGPAAYIMRKNAERSAVPAAREGVETFETVAKEYLRKHVREMGLRSADEIERTIDTYILYEPGKKPKEGEPEKRRPRWRDRAFREIRRGDISALLDQITDDVRSGVYRRKKKAGRRKATSSTADRRVGTRQAGIVLAQLRKMMSWYEVRHDDYRSPIVKGMHRTSTSKHARTRILSDDEIRALFDVAEGTFGKLVQVLLLTAQRKEKVAGMRWQDITNNRLWNVPHEERQKGVGGVLPLPSAVRLILEKMPIVDGNDYVFAGKKEGRPFSGMERAKAALDERMLAKLREQTGDPERGMEPWVLHDLRRTARSLMARANVRPDIAERVLGHAIRGVEGVYDRYGYENQKGKALEDLEAVIRSILHPSRSNVIPMPR